MEKFTDWKSFMARQDMVWTKAPCNWKEGAFLGNGCLGVQVYHEEKKKALHIELGRNDVFDNRAEGAIANDICFKNPRLPIGAYDFLYKGELVEFTMHLDLYDAVLTGHLTTNLGTITFTMFIHTKENLIFVRYEGKEGEASVYGEFTPAKAVSPRHQFGIDHNQEFRKYKDYEYYKEATVYQDGECGVSVQALSRGLQTVVAWSEETKQQQPNHTVQQVVITIGYGYEKNLVEDTIAYVKREWDWKSLEEEHRDWWETYYQRSFVSIPNRRLENFYWIQMYKLACATRENQAIMDNQGPWLSETPWPDIWWNLNVQLAYWPTYTSNRLEISQSLSNALLKYKDNLIQNVPEEYRYDSAAIGTVSTQNLLSPVGKAGTEPHRGFRELGNLTWVMHNCWLYYQMTMDETYLRELVYPILRRCVNYYQHFLKKEDDGLWHLPATSSPEYGKDCEDCNYDLALLRWGCQTLLYIVERLGIHDDKKDCFSDILEHLKPYPQGEHGYMIGRDLPYSYSHRHFSHLMMIYPLFLVTTEQEENIELMRTSFEWWWSKPEYMAGFSCTVGSLIASALGNGDEALHYLDLLWDGKLLPNTLYMEEGPVIETPLSGAQSIHEFLLQSQTGKIRIFPAVPSDWKEASFEGLCAQGGFLVSAQYENGATKWVSIQSRAGEPCVVTMNHLSDMELSDERITQLDDKTIAIKLSAGDCIEIGKKGVMDRKQVKACGYTQDAEYHYGV